MNVRTALSVPLMAVFLLGCSADRGTVSAQAETQADAQTRESVLAANEGFYEALHAMFEGDAAPMEQVWSHADDATYFPPTGEMLRGWETIRASWQAQADLKLGGTVRSEDKAVLVDDSLAVITSREVGSNPNTPSGNMQVDIRATRVYRKEGGTWKLLHSHTDKLPQLTEAIN